MKRILILALLAALAAAPAARAQDISQLTLRELKIKANELVTTNKYVQGRPYFLELIKRLDPNKAEDEAALDDLYFMVGLSYIQEYEVKTDEGALRGAVAAFKKYEEMFGNRGRRIHYALMNKVDAYMVLGELKDAAQDLEKILNPPLAASIPETGMRREALELIVYCYYHERDWKRGIPWFRRYLESARDPEKQSKAAVALMYAYLDEKAPQFEKIVELIPFLAMESPARYDIAFNGALVDGGDKLFDAGRILEAFFLYYLVLTKEEIVDYFDKLLTQQELTLKLVQIQDKRSKRIPAMQEEVAETRHTLEEARKQTTYTPELKFRKANCFKRLNRHHEAHWGFWRLTEEYPSHTDIENYYYLAFDEGIKAPVKRRAMLLGEKYLANEEWTTYRKQVSVQLAELYIELEEFEKFHPLADRYINDYPSDPYAKQFVYYIGSTRLKHREYETMVEQFGGYLEKFPNEIDMIDGLSYWKGMGGLFLQDFPGSRNLFKRILDEFEQSKYREDATFRLAVCHFGLEEYDDSETRFTEFVKNYPDSMLRGEAHVFLGDINAQKPNVAVAIKNYDLTIEFTVKHDGSQAFIDHAVFQKGELLEKNKRYEEMAEVFEDYINRFRDRGDVSNAVFRLGHALEHMGKPESMLTRYYEAIERFGDDPLAYGIDKILAECDPKFQHHAEVIKQNLEFRDRLMNKKSFRDRFFGKTQEDKAFQFRTLREVEHLDEDFRRNLLRDKAYATRAEADPEFQSEIFFKFEDRKSRFPEKTPSDQFLGLYASAKENDERTLMMRLMMTLDRIGTPVPDAAVFTEDDLYLASPATLIWISEKSRGRDPKFAEQALRLLLEEHEDSDDVMGALLALGEVAATTGDHETAYQYFKAAEDNFPDDDLTPKAVIRRGDMLVEMRRYADAIEVYKYVLKVRKWRRGEVRAETQYKLGLAHMKMEEYREAVAYFQRTFVAYPSITYWSARCYLEAGNALERDQQAQAAQKVYREFLDVPGMLRETEIYEEVKRRLK